MIAIIEPALAAARAAIRERDEDEDEDEHEDEDEDEDGDEDEDEESKDDDHEWLFVEYDPTVVDPFRELAEQMDNVHELADVQRVLANITRHLTTAMDVLRRDVDRGFLTEMHRDLLRERARSRMFDALINNCPVPELLALDTQFFFN